MLTIEDGTGKPDAQTYVSAVELRAFAAARAIPVPSDDAAGNITIEAALVTASDYLETQVCYQGKKKSSLQGLEWPRSAVYFDDVLYEDNLIPRNLKTAQIRLAIEVMAGVDLMPTISGSAADFVVKEKVGPIETEYADPSKFSGRPSFTAVNSLLASLLSNDCGQSGFFTVFRA